MERAGIKNSGGKRLRRLEGEGERRREGQSRRGKEDVERGIERDLERALHDGHNVLIIPVTDIPSQ